MNKRIEISVYSKDAKELEQLHNMIKHDAIKTNFQDDYFVVTANEVTQSIEQMLLIVERNNIIYSFHEFREYTKKERENADFLYAFFLYPWEHAPNFNSVTYGTVYSNAGKCASCGRGGKQLSELIVDLKKVGKSKISTINPELIVSSDTKKFLEDSGLSGIAFGNVKDYKDRDFPEYYQMFIGNILPPMSNEIRTQLQSETHCFECNKGGLFLRSEAIYEKEKMKNAKDFNLTQEFWGAANYCMQGIVISAKAYCELKKAKVSFAANPIRIT